MADPVVFQIEDGQVAFAVVDRSASGYSDAWQAPNGVDAVAARLSDYDASSASWKCQVTSGALTASANTNDVEVPATFCSPAKTTPQPGETSYSLDLSFLQDPNVKDGLSRFLFEHDTEEAYFLLGGDGDNPPRAIGRVRLIAGTFLGEARTTLTADVSMPCSRKPDIAFGTAADNEIVEGGGGGTVVTSTGATAGTPGTWTPAGSTPPATVADLTAGTPNAVVASPTTAWTTGQYVQTAATGTSGRAHWDGSGWVTGAAS